MGSAWNRKAGAHRGAANFYEKDNIVTRKDFELIRDVIRTIKDETTRHEVATTFAIQLKNQNPRFNTVRFIAESCRF